MILLDCRRRGERSDWLGRAQQVRKDGRGIEVALVNRAQHTGQDFLRMGAAQRAIPSAHFARHDGGSQRMLGAPVGRVDRVWFEQEGEDGREFDGEMRRKVARDATAAPGRSMRALS